MKFSQLTLRDVTLPGDFELRYFQDPDQAGGRIPMFIGEVVADHKRALANEVMHEATKRLLQRDARGRRIAVPVGAVVWAEIAEDVANEGAAASPAPPPQPKRVSQPDSRKGGHERAHRSPDWGPFNRAVLFELHVSQAEMWRIAGVTKQTELVAKYTTQAAIDRLLEKIRAERKAPA